jgi:hypothetical protein
LKVKRDRSAGKKDTFVAGAKETRRGNLRHYSGSEVKLWDTVGLERMVIVVVEGGNTARGKGTPLHILAK